MILTKHGLVLPLIQDQDCRSSAAVNIEVMRLAFVVVRRAPSHILLIRLV